MPFPPVCPPAPPGSDDGIAAALPNDVWQATATATADVTPHVKGPWTEVIASTSAAVDVLNVVCYNSFFSGADRRALLDVGIGAAGSEVVIAANLPCGFGSNPFDGMAPILLPLNIPAGSRIAIRTQAFVTAATVAVTLIGSKSNLSTASPSSLDTLGADTATSTGVNLPTDNVYVEIVAATAQEYRALSVLPCGIGTSFGVGEPSTYTLGLGPAGFEVDAVSFVVYTSSTERVMLYPAQTGRFAGYYRGPIPAGTRIACKQSVGRTYRNVIVVGIP